MNQYPVFSSVQLQTYSAKQLAGQHIASQLFLDGWEALAPHIEQHGLEGALRECLARGEKQGLSMAPFLLRFLTDQLTRQSLSDEDIVALLDSTNGSLSGDTSLLFSMVQHGHDDEQDQRLLQSFESLLKKLGARSGARVLDLLRSGPGTPFRTSLADALHKGIGDRIFSSLNEIEAWQAELYIQRNQIDRLQLHWVSNGEGHSACVARACRDYSCENPGAIFVVLQKNESVYKSVVSLIDADRMEHLNVRERNACVGLANLIIDVDRAMGRSTPAHVVQFAFDHCIASDYPSEATLFNVDTERGNYPGERTLFGEELLALVDESQVGRVESKDPLSEEVVLRSSIDSNGLLEGVHAYLALADGKGVGGAAVVCRHLALQIKAGQMSDEDLLRVLKHAEGAPTMDQSTLFKILLEGPKEVDAELSDALIELLDLVKPDTLQSILLLQGFKSEDNKAESLVYRLLDENRLHGLLRVEKLIARCAERLNGETRWKILNGECRRLYVGPQSSTLNRAMTEFEQTASSASAIRCLKNIAFSMKMSSHAMAAFLDTVDLRHWLQTALDDLEYEGILTAFCELVIAVQSDPGTRLDDSAQTILHCHLPSRPKTFEYEYMFQEARPQIHRLLQQTRHVLMDGFK